jgi:hypothetical protein
MMCQSSVMDFIVNSFILVLSRAVISILVVLRAILAQ